MTHALHAPIRHNAWGITWLLSCGIVIAVIEDHGSEHRGQICSILSADGHEPPDLTSGAYAAGRIRQ